MADTHFVVNGARASTLSVRDRGLHYGDGVFRTLLVQDGQWIDEALQYAKLQRDAESLGIICPPLAQWRADFTALPTTRGLAVLKCLLTRGVSQRGYATPIPPTPPTRILALQPAPVYPSACWQAGIDLILCQQRWGHQPQLAGIKHLNRLEQVLSRTEVVRSDAREGLMLDLNGCVISGTMSNLFMLENGSLITPKLHECGIEGVMRARILLIARSLNIETYEQPVELSRLEHAQEVFLCNSLIGIWPAKSLDRIRWPVGHVTRQLQEELNHPRLLA